MCGFAGGVFTNEVVPEKLDRALNLLHHRGPDSVGRWISADRRWALGHTRLSIIGLDNGTQPISDSERDLHLVVNGEFYGYREIRQQLRDEGHVFATDSDSEIALHLYKRDGMSMLKHLRGEFAAVIADRRNNAMIGIRDRFGIKPLFYAVHEGNVVFASEIKALLALGVPARWDLPGITQSPRTAMFRCIRTGMFRSRLVLNWPGIGAPTRKLSTDFARCLSMRCANA